MSWLKTILGYVVGNAFFGPIGGLIGAVLVSKLWKDDEDGGIGGRPPSPERDGKRTRAAGGEERPSGANSAQQELVFLASAAAMMAKLAKADGHVSMSEIDSAERAFKRLGLSDEKREFCIMVFRKAKEDSHTIYEYAQSFAAAQPDRDIRELFYDILWDLASADGVVSPEELTILDKLTYSLRIRRFLFTTEAAKHRAQTGGAGQGASDQDGRGGGGGGRRAASSEMSLSTAYKILGCTPRMSDADLKKAYREKAKKFHPDELAAQGVSPELMEKATRHMAEINAAWAEIKKARGMGK